MPAESLGHSERLKRKKSWTNIFLPWGRDGEVGLGTRKEWRTKRQILRNNTNKSAEKVLFIPAFCVGQQGLFWDFKA